MSHSWDDFQDSKTRLNDKDTHRGKNPVGPQREEEDEQSEESDSCNWGFRGEVDDQTVYDQGNEDNYPNLTSRFIPIYERYLADKQSIVLQTQNLKLFASNPQKALRDWFENEGHDFSLKTEQVSENQFVCKIDLPIEEHDFTISSELHSKRKAAMDDVCLATCRMLDDCQLLYPTTWQQSSSNTSKTDELNKKRQIREANKEDDLEFDKTRELTTKRHRGDLYGGSAGPSTASSSSRGVTSNASTYKSLMARWNELSMSILKLKAQLVKLDLSIAHGGEPKRKSANPLEGSGGGNGDEDGRGPKRNEAVDRHEATKEQNEAEEAEDDELDPLDEFMSKLETKTKFTIDEKIEKSRLKAQIVDCEREQHELANRIAAAKQSA